MIDPKQPDYSNTPVSPARPCFGYEPRSPESEPIVTVITPFYNTGAVFHETAQTVFQQSFQQWEWLIINDGTTDPESLGILDAYRNRDPRIRVIDQENRGPSAARNSGFLQARCEYIFQLDSDDLIEPTTLEKCVWFLESHPEYAFAKGFSVGFGAQSYLWQRGFNTPNELLSENPITNNCLVRKSAHESIGGYDESIRHGFEDWDFWLHATSLGLYGGTIPEYLDWYRRRDSHQDRWVHWDGSGTRKFLDDARAKYPSLWLNRPVAQPERPFTAQEPVPSMIPFANPLSPKGHHRILALTVWLTMGGADLFLHNLVDQLTKIGHKISIATTNTHSNPWLSQFASLTPDIFPLGDFLRAPDYPRFLSYLIESRQIDTVLVTNSYLAYGLLAYIRSHHPGVRIVDYIHMEEEYWKSGGYPRASINHAHLLDLTVVSSQHLMRWIQKNGGASKPIEVCTTNIDSSLWDPARFDRSRIRGDLGIGADDPVILYAGRLTQQKQPELFAQCVRELSRNSSFVCLVAGDGEYFGYLRAFVKAHRLDCVRLLGAVPNSRVQELLAASDIFFLPSEMEGISLAIYEAMAMGCVPVGADVGGQSELVTQDCGILVRRGPREQRDYVAALKSLLIAPDLRRKMGSAARQRILDRYPLKEMGQRMSSLLSQRTHGSSSEDELPVIKAIGLQTAAQALEIMRLEVLADQLWATRSVQSAPRNLLKSLMSQIYYRLLPWMGPFRRQWVALGVSIKRRIES